MIRSHEIREAHHGEAGFLSELAIRSKAHWGYSQDFLDACRAELAVDPDEIRADEFQCFVAVDGKTVLGYYSARKKSLGVYELEALFVDPDYIGTGVGGSLIRHAVRLLSKQGCRRLVIQGDPNATAFYIAAGARQIGFRESGSIPGRQLPLFEIVIESH